MDDIDDPYLYVTRYEKCRIISYRCLQIIKGDKVCLTNSELDSLNTTDPLTIAEEEYRLKRLRIGIQRREGTLFLAPRKQLPT